MKYETSCGAVVFTKENQAIKYLLIQNKEGIYGFPKGHMEGTESERETALREVFEETHVNVTLLDGFRTVDEHPIPQKENTIKQIIYFLGFFENQKIIYQEEELSSACLVSYAEAMNLFSIRKFKTHSRRGTPVFDGISL